MNNFNVTCCGQSPRWVENIPGKGYFFCGECKSEVLEPLKVENPKSGFVDAVEAALIEANKLLYSNNQLLWHSGALPSVGSIEAPLPPKIVTDL